jgi:hypothetical protein
MVRVVTTSLIFMFSAVTNAFALVAVPGPDIESGLLSMSVVAGLIYFANRRRKKS